MNDNEAITRRNLVNDPSIQNAVLAAQAGVAVRRKAWPIGVEIAHAGVITMRLSDNSKIMPNDWVANEAAFNPTIADILAKDWVASDSEASQ